MTAVLGRSKEAHEAGVLGVQGSFPGRDEISIGGLEEGLVLTRRRRDKEAASRGGMQSESIKYVSAEGNRERAAEHGKGARQIMTSS